MLKLIEDTIFEIFGKLLANFSLLNPQKTGELSTDLIRELGYDSVASSAKVAQIEPQLLPEQRQSFNLRTNRIANGQGAFYSRICFKIKDPQKEKRFGSQLARHVIRWRSSRACRYNGKHCQLSSGVQQ